MIKVKEIWNYKTWEEYYKKQEIAQIKPKKGFFSSYDIYLCDSILDKYLPKKIKRKLNFCEIGCGDGKLTKKICTKFNYNPYGIEYSKNACKIAQKMGIKIIQDDVFSKKVKQNYKNFFDVVFSYGFIEHILPVEKAIQVHLDLLKKNGILVIQIPRFKGFNYLKLKLFRPDLIPLHNMEIMEPEIIHSIMKKFKCKELICKKYGTFKTRLFFKERGFKFYLLKLINLLEFIINPLFRIIFRDKGFETNFFSPSIIFIAKKIK